MKRILTAVIIAVVLSASIYAAGDFGNLGITGGYTSKENTALFGFNGAYQFTADVSDYVGIGFGTHADFAFGLNHSDRLPLFFGWLFGMGLDICFNDSMALNISMGPSMVLETGAYDGSVGIGVGLDAAFSCYFDRQHSVGLSAGATIYPQFVVIDDSRDDVFSIAALGYIGLALRFPAPASLLALPALPYIIY